MTQYSRLRIAAVLLSCLAAQAWGAPAQLDARTQWAVETATRHQGAETRGAALLRAAGAESLLSLTLGDQPGASALTVRLSGLPTCNTFSLGDGRRVVIDLRNTVNLHHGVHLRAEGEGVLRGVRTSIFSTDPEFVSRLVLDLDRPCDFTIETLEDRIVVRLTEKAADHAALLAGTSAGKEYIIEMVVDPPVPAKTWLPAHGRLDTLAAQLSSLFDAKQTPARKVSQRIIMAKAEKAAPVTRLSRLVDELNEVADAEVDLALNPGFQDAAQAEGGASSGEAGADDTETEPAPPGPRIEQMPADPNANRNFLRALRDARAANAPEEEVADVSAESGLADFETFAAPAEGPVPELKMEAPTSAYQGDPLYQPMDLDFRDAEISFVVAMLANQANVNVMGGGLLTGNVTIKLRNVPLKQAMETTLSLNGLGLINKAGIYYIVSYDEAMQAQRRTTFVELKSAKASELQTVLETILQGDQDFKFISIASHKTANTLVIRAPESRLEELVALAEALDTTQVLPAMITVTIPLNWADPQELVPLVQSALTREGQVAPGVVGADGAMPVPGAGAATGPSIAGTVAADPRGKNLIVTDQPIVIEQVRVLIASLDTPPKQVYIDIMIVDVVLSDAAETGVDWLLSAVRRQSRRDAALGTGRSVGNLQDLSFGSNLGLGQQAGALAFSVLSNDIDWSGIVQAEVRNDDSRLISRPQIQTLENKQAAITISQEIPYVELTESSGGGTATSTAFKDIGTILTVTPRVTHDNHIIVELDVKESDTGAIFAGVPIENKRELSTSAMVRSGGTLLVGGLRRNNYDTSVRKVPFFGDVPLLSFLFRNNVRSESVNELLIFLTCHVLEEEPILTDYQQEKFDYGFGQDLEMDVQNEVIKDILRPNKTRKPIWRSGDDDD